MDPLVLDYVGVAVASLDAGEATYRRLGFQLTERSFHEGRATGNHCAILREGYLEILGVARPEVPTTFGEWLDRYEGVHIVAFGCGEAEEAYRALHARNPAVRPAELLERDAPFGADGAATRRAVFRNLYPEESALPEARFIFIEHVTPEVVWQPHLQAHPNGALSLAEVAICSGEIDATAARLAQVLDVPAQSKGEGIRTLDLARGRLYVLSPETVPMWAKGAIPPRVPSVVGIGVTVRDLGATKTFLEQQGIAYRAHPYPAIWVDPSDAAGAVLSFIQA